MQSEPKYTPGLARSKENRKIRKKLPKPPSVPNASRCASCAPLACFACAVLGGDSAPVAHALQAKCQKADAALLAFMRVINMHEIQRLWWQAAEAYARALAAFEASSWVGFFLRAQQRGLGSRRTGHAGDPANFATRSR